VTHRLRRGGRTAVLGLSLLVALGTPTGAAPVKGDPLLPRQWGLAQVNAVEAWRTATGKGVVVAVIDGGVDASHPDLRGRVLPGRDLVRGEKNAWRDVDGHGTQVAGIIAAARGNGAGIAGIAPDARILPVKNGEFQSMGSLTPTAVRWAADKGAKVIVISEETIAGLDAVAPHVIDVETQAAIEHAWSRGAVIVVAAGNNSEPICSSPASLDRVLCVGAVDRRRTKPVFSSFDASMTRDYLVAPGGSDVAVATEGADEHVWTTTVPGTGTTTGSALWTQVRGTSFAAPHVAGVAALLVELGLSNREVVARLTQTAADLGPAGRDPVYGYGLVDAAAAVRSRPAR
jgi:subtilisin family serine protease